MITARNFFLVFLAICLLIYALSYPIQLYSGQMESSLSSKNSDWGDFGSFFGGVYGSILSAFALIVAIGSAFVTNMSNATQISLIRNEQNFNQFTQLLNHLKDNYISEYTINYTRNSITKIYYEYEIWLSIGFTDQYNPELSLEKNLVNTAVQRYKTDDYKDMLFKESRLFVCLIKFIENSPSELANAMKVIFENTFENSQRFALEMYTRAHHENVVGFLDNWPTLSSIPEGTLEAAQRQLRLNNLL